MKRISLHVAFWTSYVLQDSLLMFTWVGPSLTGFSETQILKVSVWSSIVILVPKLFVIYFLLQKTIPAILKGEQKLIRILIPAALVFLAGLALYRLLSMYYVNPVLFHSLIPAGRFADIRRWLLALMDMGFVSGLAISIKFIHIQLANRDKEKSLLREKLETELKFLKNQTNPHFLLNTLNNVYGLARKKSDETAEVILKLSELLRFTLYETSHAQIPLANEIGVLDDYIALEKMRYSNRLSVNFEQEVDRSQYRITPLLLLPLVENAFKYGISETRFDSHVGIKLAVRDAQLHFYVENTFEGQSEEDDRQCIGLQNVRRQLELLYADYKLDISTDEQTFRIHLFINLNSYGNL